MPSREFAKSLPPKKGMIRVAPMAAIPALLREFGVAPGPLLKKFGLSEETFSQPDRTIPFELLGRVISACARESGCPHFGLLVGQRNDFSALGATGFLMKNAPDVATALKEAILNIDLHDRGAIAFLEVSHETAVLGYAIYQPGIEGSSQIGDGSLAVIWNIMRGLCGDEWLPREVRFCHDGPPAPGAYRRFFRAPLRFNAVHYALVFHSSWLTRRIDQSDPVLRQHFQQHIQGLRRYTSQDFGEKAYQALLLLIGSQPCSLDDLASHFLIHPRTLNRRLREAGTSFRALHNETRHQTACQLLRDTRTRIESIAALLGYSDGTAFNRAFSQWQGVPPGKWRRQMQVARG
jgi:AraC-like DNA-binding protein